LKLQIFFGLRSTYVSDSDLARPVKWWFRA